MLEKILIAAENFLKRVNELESVINADRIFSENHGIKWTAGDWQKEKQDLEKLIEEYKFKECPECLRKIGQVELDIFNGFCENCCEKD